MIKNQQRALEEVKANLFLPESSEQGEVERPLNVHYCLGE